MTEIAATKSYRDRGGKAADFRVSYRFLTAEEGGRKVPPQQHGRWDFMYAGDDPQKEGVWMIWPEFISEDGTTLPQGVVPASGLADMYVVVPESRLQHLGRLRAGVKCHFVEGARVVANCIVVAVLALADNPRTPDAPAPAGQ